MYGLIVISEISLRSTASLKITLMGSAIAYCIVATASIFSCNLLVDIFSITHEDG